VLSKSKKRAILIIFDVLFSTFIWNINYSWGNTFLVCFTLSTTTFLIIYTPFEIYWSFRDLWFDRWTDIVLEDILINRIKIKVHNGFIIANLISLSNKAISKTRNTIIIICHGFSDTKDELQHFFLPFVYQGYTILAYDARGTGESKKLGKRSNFVERIEDYKQIINWLSKNSNLNKMKIYAAGFSIGAITIISGSFCDERIKKIIAISTISKFTQNFHKFNPVIIINYFLKGVRLSQKLEENKIISPYNIIDICKKTVSDENFNKFSERIFLIHSRNDNIIKIKNFQENAELLNLKPTNKLIFKKGGHIQKKNEMALAGACLNYFNS